MQIILAMALTQTKYDNIDDATLFIKVARYINRNLAVDAVKSEFARITQLQLIENSRLDHYKQLYAAILPHIQNKELINEIAALYNYELGRFYYNKGDRAESRDYFFNALKCKPANSDMRVAFISSISEYLSEQDLLGAVDKLEVYIKEFPFIKEHAQISKLLKNSYLFKAYLSFQDQKIEEGNKNLLKFETLHGELHNNYIESELLANAYSSASAYFYKKNNVKKAKEYVNRGLKADPNNYILKNLLRSM
jgi:tetratricopeptide (TPR) repeat protein